jgi:hypothetical protein
MQKAKIFAVDAALLIGISSAALAQQRSMGDQIIQNNAARSGSTDHGGIRSGSVANTEKIFGNHNGYQQVIEYSSRARR